MSLFQVVAWLREHLSAPWLSLEPDGSCAVHFPSLSIAIVPYEARGGFNLRSQLGNVANADFTVHLEELLQANLFSDGLGAHVFGLDTGGNIFLTRPFALDRLSQENFLPAFDQFLGWARQWQQRLPASQPVEAAHGG